MAVDWKSPQVVYDSTRAAILIAHTVFGLYSWEFLTTLYHDWTFIRGRPRRKFNFTGILYWSSRYMTLLTLASGIRICNAMSADVPCKAWVYFSHVTGYICLASSSGLLYMRVVAISGGDRFVTWGLGVPYVGCWGLIAWAAYHTDAVWFKELHICAAKGYGPHYVNTVYQFSFDIACLAVMLLLVLRMHRGRRGSLGAFLEAQGAVYFACVCVAYLVLTIFVLLDLNDAVSKSSAIFALVVTTICATRMQRSLEEFLHSSSNAPSSTSTSGHGTSTAMPFPSRRPISDLDARAAKADSETGLSAGYKLDLGMKRGGTGTEGDTSTEDGPGASVTFAMSSLGTDEKNKGMAPSDVALTVPARE